MLTFILTLRKKRKLSLSRLQTVKPALPRIVEVHDDVVVSRTARN